MKMLHTIGDFERIGDHAVNISNCAKEIYDKKLNFSERAQAELNVVISAVSAIVVTTIEAYVNNDLDKAHKVEPLDELIGDLCDELKIRHVKRLQSGECTLDHGFTFNDLLTNFERIGAHCSNIAVATIELSHDVYDTHEYLEKFKAENLNDYNKNFEEYSLQYKLEEV